MDEIQHTFVRCPLRGQSNGNVGSKLERGCRTCPGPGRAPAKNHVPVRSLLSSGVIRGLNQEGKLSWSRPTRRYKGPTSQK